VFGQDKAIDAGRRSAWRARGWAIPGSHRRFLFSGPTGVGKTEVARQLAYYSASGAPLRMSSTERHAVSRLIGAPPGYVGFDQGGQLPKP
jgi:ATP-dependent Clp protease ATP-binding subunit ClpA